MYDLTQMADGRYRAESKLTGITLIWRKGDFEASQEVIYEQPLFDKWYSKRKNLTSALAHEMRLLGDYIFKNHPDKI